MESAARSWTLGEIAALIGGELRGPADFTVRRPAPADSDDAEGIAFAENEKYLAAAEASGVGALLVGRDTRPTSKPAIAVDNPRMMFGMLLAVSVRPLAIDSGVHATALVHPEASVAESASVGAYAVIERGAVVGENCRVHAFCYIGENCRLGEGVVMYPHAVLVQDVEVGARSILHSGSVLGTDGFGFIRVGPKLMKVPQVGRVALGEDVEIGALSAVDRATAGVTRLGRGTKLDNFVQVAHNVSVGEDTVITGQVGIAGSVRIGSRVTMGAQAGIADHATIGDDVMLAARSAVSGTLAEPGTYLGVPAIPAGKGARAMMLVNKLPDLLDRIRTLEKRVAELEGKGE